MLDPTALAQLHDATAFERAVLDALGREVGSDVAFFATLGSPPATIGLAPDKLARAFADRRYEHELLPVKQSALRARGVAVDTHVLGELGVRSTAYHREFARPIGGRHTLLAWMGLRERPLGVIMLGRTGSCWSDAELARVEDALPAISVCRASYGNTWHSQPLRVPATPAWARLRAERTLATAMNRDGATIRVRDRHGYRDMVANHRGAELVWSSAAIVEPRRSAWFYVDLFHVAAARARARERVLFIGCGGAVSPKQFAEVYPGIAIDLVELDSTVVALANDWYGLASIPALTVHIADGANFLSSAPAARWDVVVIDAYSTELASEFLSAQLFQHVHRVLRPGGQMAFNAIGTLAGPSAVQAVEEAARTVLADVRLVPVLDQDEPYAPDALRNVVVLGGRASS